MFQRTNIGTGFHNYQGYAVASGRFLTTNRRGNIIDYTESDVFRPHHDSKKLFTIHMNIRFCSLIAKKEHVLWSG